MVVLFICFVRIDVKVGGICWVIMIGILFIVVLIFFMMF